MKTVTIAILIICSFSSSVLWANLSVFGGAELTVVGTLSTGLNDVIIHSGGVVRVETGSVTQAGVVEIKPGGLLVGCGTLDAKLVNNGTVVVDCGTTTGLELLAPTTNTGDFVLQNDSGFTATASTFDNQGALDMRFGDALTPLPGQFSNTGRVLPYGANETLGTLDGLWTNGTDIFFSTETSMAYSYHIEYTNDLILGPWQDATTIRPGGDNLEFTLRNAIPGLDERFFRLVEE